MLSPRTTTRWSVLRLLLVVVFFITSVFAQAGTIEALKSMLATRKGDAEKADLLNAILSEYLSDTSATAPDSIARYQKMAMTLAKSSHYKRGEARTFYLVGKHEMNRKNHLDKATLYMLRSLALYESMKDSVGLSRCYLQLGVMSYELQSYPDAINYFRTGLNFSVNKSVSAALSHYLMALSYSELNDLPNAVALFDSSLAEYRTTNDTIGILNCQSFIGKMYVNAGDFNKAIAHLTKVIADAHQQVDSLSLIPAFSFLSSAYLKNNDTPNAIRYGLCVVRLAERAPGAVIYLKEA